MSLRVLEDGNRIQARTDGARNRICNDVGIEASASPAATFNYTTRVYIARLKKPNPKPFLVTPPSLTSSRVSILAVPTASMAARPASPSSPPWVRLQRRRRARTASIQYQPPPYRIPRHIHDAM